MNGRIAAITRAKPKGKATVIDAKGLVVAPGFVQTHIHLCQTLFRNQADDLELLDWLSQRIWPMEAAHTPGTLKTSALLGIHELLASGTTCILDMGTVRHTDQIFRAVRDSGIRANVGKCLMDHPERTPEGLRESTESALAEARALHKTWNGACGDRIRASFAPRFVISCTEELMREVSKLSRESRAVIHTHASESRKEIELVRELSGLENVDYLKKLGLLTDRLVMAHGVWLSDAEIAELSAARSSVTHCPGSNLKLASGIARVPELRARGVNVALGADGAPCNNNLDAFHEMRLAATLHKPRGGPRTLRAQEVLDMATRDGAKALHWFDDIGSIEVGKKADLVALDLSAPENLLPETAAKTPSSDALASAIVYATGPSHVRWTMVDGRTLYAGGKVKTIARAPLVAAARRAQLKIARALGHGGATLAFGALLLAATALPRAARADGAGVDVAKACEGVPSVTIGCTVGCDSSFRKAIDRAAHKLRVAVRYENLYGLRGDVKLALGSADAVLTPGGKDISPKYYLEAVPAERRARLKKDYERLGKRTDESQARDRFEAALFKAYLSDKRFERLPVLGVCYGMQMLSVASGLPLVIDIHERFGIANRYGVTDEAHFDEGSRAREIFGAAVVPGHEEHHQAVDLEAYRRLAPEGVRISATSNEGRIPEAIELVGRPALGVQFHPEKSKPEVGDAVFGWLLERACAARREAR